jgi:L-seryl-tRNA(Ser) seleniumtransferase
LRVDKLTYAALEATLLAYVRQDHDSIPGLRMMRLPAGQIRQRAEALAARLALSAPKLGVEVVEGESVIGGGSTPGARLPTWVLAVTAEGLSADQAAARLRAAETPVIARVEEGRVLLDLRTVFPQQDAAVEAALIESLNH